MDVSYHIDYMYVRIFWHVYLVTFEQFRVTGVTCGVLVAAPDISGES